MQKYIHSKHVLLIPLMHHVRIMVVASGLWIYMTTMLKVNGWSGKLQADFSVTEWYKLDTICSLACRRTSKLLKH